MQGVSLGQNVFNVSLSQEPQTTRALEMPAILSLLSLLLASNQPVVEKPPYTVHDITRIASIGFENLAVRDNGQILVTSTHPNASVFQVDPFGILPTALIYRIPTAHSANGIAEGQPGIFYVASGDINFQNHFNTTPSSHTITEIDVRDVHVMLNGSLSKQPAVREVTTLPEALLLNGVDIVPQSDHLLVGDSWAGLIWNVNVATGNVAITLNDTSTRGPGPVQIATGINGLKVFNGSVYWTNTGASSMWKVAIDASGNVAAGAKPILITSELSCDDFCLDSEGNAYVAAPQDVLTKVSPDGNKTVLAGTLDSNRSSLVGPTAVRFGRLRLDQRSLYITTNGNLTNPIPADAGVSRIDLGRRQLFE